jgi:hypothetical protein
VATESACPPRPQLGGGPPRWHDARVRAYAFVVVLAWLPGALGCGNPGQPTGPLAPGDSDPAKPVKSEPLRPLAEDPASNTVPTLGDLRMERAEADALMVELGRLPKFPLRLSELEAHLGRPVRRHFNPESLDPTFVHDRGGQGVNVGGTPVFHPSGEPNTPLLVELRSQYYARYDTERKFDQRPPFAADDPVIDLITISARYAKEPPPPAPSTSVFEGNYAYIAEQWSIAPLHDGYLSLLTHDRSINPQADRWVFQLTTDRGHFQSSAQVDQVETMLLGFVETIRDGKDMPTMLATLEREHAAHYDMGILALGLGSYNIRYFDVDLPEGPHAGEFLRKEGLSRALYIDFYIQGEARVPLPRFFRALGFEKATVDPSQVPEVAPGHQDGGFLYYNDVTLEGGGWYVRATGFYPVAKGGKAASTVDLSRFLVRSLTIRHQVR